MEFSQNVITTLHNIRVNDSLIEKEVEGFSQDRKCALVIPVLYRDLIAPPMKLIEQQFSKMDYLNGIIIPITVDKKTDFKRTVKHFAKDKRVKVIWCESPRITNLLKEITGAGIDLPPWQGKGKAIWLAIGLGSMDNYAIALHDADIETYDRHVVSRMLFPLLEPSLKYSFSKGYYSRLTDNRLYGRVARLFLWPLIDSLNKTFKGESMFLKYLRSFRYPISGEMGITSSLAQSLRIPYDWGLEIGILAEVYKRAALARICEVDLDVYSHKHQGLGANKDEGLLKMAMEILTTILRTTTEQDGLRINQHDLHSITVLYRKIAQDYIDKYRADSRFNSFEYDMHVEDMFIERISKHIVSIGDKYFRDPSTEQFPNWHTVLSVSPDITTKIMSSKKQKKLILDEIDDAITKDIEDAG